MDVDQDAIILCTSIVAIRQSSEPAAETRRYLTHVADMYQVYDTRPRHRRTIQSSSWVNTAHQKLPTLGSPDGSPGSKKTYRGQPRSYLPVYCIGVHETRRNIHSRQKVRSTDGTLATRPQTQVTLRNYKFLKRSTVAAFWARRHRDAHKESVRQPYAQPGRLID